ncbi:MAG: EVE domain-containing protein [Bacteroidetes bacterium]|nr:EVE domain-containing protein [Bacteroidota bacterium]
MNHWLVKSEPSTYSWEKFLKDKKAVWDGVRNYAARLNLRAMKKGDFVYFYHSNEGLCIVGIAKVMKEAYQDPTTKEDWSVVDLEPYKTLKRPVTLAEIKADKLLQNIYLVRQGRLSVMPLRKEEFDRILELSAINE